MDPFNELPMEIRLEILLSIRTKESMAALICASPTLLRLYLSVKAEILRNLVAADLDDELIQHAVAIVEFPDRTQFRKAHLAAWNERQLPNPLQGHYPQIFEKVDKLHSLILRFMQDYIAKATSDFPSREYLCLPNIHAPALDGHTVFRGQMMGILPRTDQLTYSERNRFLKVFLLFELNCKAVESGLGSRVPYDGPKVLVSHRDNEAVQCIHAYVCSLHGALFGQCGDAWLPEPPNESSLQPGLKFPDSLYLDPNTYLSDLGIPQVHDGGGAADFAKFGLELVVELLAYEISNPQQKESLLVRLRDFWNSYQRRVARYSHLIFEVSPHLADEGLIYDHLKRQLTSTRELQREVFQQRAWVFFDDARLYPLRCIAPHFPSAAILEDERYKMVWFQGWEDNSARIRALCRSQKWHDDYKKEMDSDA
ncbi:hypothetical protein FMEXI_11828 [Fusarium mexicanum]|uniref:Uncharacterized protein n=1 Tax=Fusarium mexicanum TaxID=751941 RepID=A0A8H5IFE4_9HYPO|nr:hypothetical protein FMEXI_11828 [Fusarium mexicanum]